MTIIDGITQKSNAPARLEARIKLVKWLVNNGLHVVSLRPATGAPNPKKGLPAHKGWEKNPLKLEDVEREVKTGRGFGIMPTGSWCYVDLDSDSEHASKADGVGNYKALFKQAGKQLPATLTAKNESNGNLHLFFNMGAISAGVNATGNKPLAPGLELANVNHYVRVLDPEYNGDTTDAYTFNDSLDLNKSFSELLAPLPAELEPLIATWLKATKPATTAQGKELTDEQYKAHGLNYDSNSLGPVQLFNRWAEKSDLTDRGTWLGARLQIATAERLKLIEPGEADTMLERLSAGKGKWLKDNTDHVANDTRKHPKVTFGEFFRKGLLPGMQPQQETGKAQLPANGSETAPDSRLTTPATGEATANPYAFAKAGANMNQYKDGDARVTKKAFEVISERHGFPFELVDDSISGLTVAVKPNGAARQISFETLFKQCGEILMNEVGKYGIVPTEKAWARGMELYTNQHRRNLWGEQVVSNAATKHYDTSTGNVIETATGRVCDERTHFINLGVRDTPLNRKLGGMVMRALVCQGLGTVKDAQGTSHRLSEQGLEAIVILTGEGNAGKTTAVRSLSLELPWLYQKINDPDYQANKGVAEQLSKGLVINFDDNERALFKSNEQALKGLLTVEGKELEFKYQSPEYYPAHWIHFLTTNSQTPLEQATSARKYIVFPFETGVTGHAWDVLTRGELGKKQGASMGNIAHGIGTDIKTRLQAYAIDDLGTALCRIMGNDWDADTTITDELASEMEQANAEFSKGDMLEDIIAELIKDQQRNRQTFTPMRDIYAKAEDKGTTTKDKTRLHSQAKEVAKKVALSMGWKWARPTAKDGSKLPEGLYRLDERGRMIKEQAEAIHEAETKDPFTGKPL